MVAQTMPSHFICAGQRFGFFVTKKAEFMTNRYYWGSIPWRVKIPSLESPTTTDKAFPQGLLRLTTGPKPGDFRLRY